MARCRRLFLSSMRSRPRTLLQKTLRLLAQPLHWPVWLLACLLPKDRRLWVFGAWGGWRYCDNSQWLFEHVSRHHSEIRAVWVTRSRVTCTRLRAQGYECHRMFSPLGYWLTMRAGAVLCTHPHASDHNLFAVGGRTRIIQLWHGTPIKKIGRDDAPLRARTATPLARLRGVVNRGFTWVFPWLRERMHVFAAASEATVANYMSAFGLAREQFRVTGQPRTDSLLRARPRSEPGLRILYMPTFRGELGDRVDLLAGFDLPTCERVMQEIGGKLWLRIHPSNHPDESAFVALLRSPWVAHFDAEDVYAELAGFDMLVTDYSSIVFDYLLLDRPVVFAPFDLDSYVAGDRELYYPYEAVSPGPIARSWPEVFARVAELAADPHRFAAERRAVCGRFNAFSDGMSCARTVKMIREELGLAAEVSLAATPPVPAD